MKYIGWVIFCLVGGLFLLLSLLWFTWHHFFLEINAIDLNTNLKGSEVATIKARLFDPQIEKKLMPFMPSKKIKQAIESIPFKLNDYLELVDWTGRAIRADKRGSIAGSAPPILERLNIDAQQWIKQPHQLEKNYPSFIGQWQSIENACAQFKRKRIKAKQYSQLLLSG